MNNWEVVGYNSYASNQALKLAKWSLEIDNRVKASKIKKIADKMENKYRKSKEFKNKERQNRLASLNGGVYTCLYRPLIINRPKMPMKSSVKNG